MIDSTGRRIPIRLVRHAQARRISLRVDQIKGEVRLTLPRRTKVTDTAVLIASHQAWIAARVEALPTPVPFTGGSCFPLEGRSVSIDWAPDRRRLPRLCGSRLEVGGPASHIATRITSWLKRQALERLTEETRALAERIERDVTSVRVGDPRGRWGSCSSGGTIAYSWRLILAPPSVRQSVVAHEVAHLQHHDHSPRFHALHRQLLGDDPAAARAWLANHGAALHWVGRSA